MKKWFKNSVFAIALTSLVLGLFLPWYRNFAYAEQNLQPILQDVSTKLDSLSDLNNGQLTGEEKAAQELKIRKEALGKIFELTLAEDQDLTDKLNAIPGLTGERAKIRDYLVKSVEENDNAYRELRDRLDAADNLKKIKQLAKDFQNWRTLVYAPKVQKVITFALIFRQNNILKIAEQRLEKIEKDLAKLDDSQESRLGPARSLLKTAAGHLEKAKLTNSKAELFLLDTLTKEVLGRSFKEPKIAEIKGFIENSLNWVRMAYKIFLEIGRFLNS